LSGQASTTPSRPRPAGAPDSGYRSCDPSPTPTAATSTPHPKRRRPQRPGAAACGARGVVARTSAVPIMRPITLSRAADLGCHQPPGGRHARGADLRYLDRRLACSSALAFCAICRARIVIFTRKLERQFALRHVHSAPPAPASNTESTHTSTTTTATLSRPPRERANSTSPSTAASMSPAALRVSMSSSPSSR
jgi:hypothetical protein